MTHKTQTNNSICLLRGGNLLRDRAATLAAHTAAAPPKVGQHFSRRGGELAAVFLLSAHACPTMTKVEKSAVRRLKFDRVSVAAPGLWCDGVSERDSPLPP